MTIVLLLVTSLWTLPHLFEGLDIVIEDGSANVTIFESLLQDNDTNITTVHDMETTVPSETTILTNAPSQDLPTTISSTKEETKSETTLVELSSTTTTTIISTEAQNVATGEEETVTEITTSEIPMDLSTEVMPQAGPDATMISINDNPDLIEYYGEECGLEGGLQCDASVKCRGRGTINCNVKEEIQGVRRNVSLLGRMSTQAIQKRSAAVTALECRVIGKVICFPTPTVSNCKGEGSCIPLSEQNFGPRSLQDWEIAVITVLCVVGLLLIFLMIYILYSSFKKLKVRPDIQRYPSAQTA